MERLSRRWGPEEKQISGHAICEFNHCPEDTTCASCVYGQKNNRLADIEDILGDNYDLDRLRELVNADRDGRCVVLQYKKNDVAYSIKHNPFIRKVVVRQMLVDTDNGVVWYHCIDDLWNPDFFVSCDIGKTVFRTREEAEAALKARKRVENDV